MSGQRGFSRAGIGISSDLDPTAWLESPFDAFTAAGVRDSSGLAGSYVGQQLEARIRWDILPGNCRLDTGVATLFKGSFLQNAPNANPNGDTLYAWVECTVTF